MKVRQGPLALLTWPQGRWSLQGVCGGPAGHQEHHQTMKSKIHTNIYCPCPGVGESGVQRTPQGGGRGSGGKTVSRGWRALGAGSALRGHGSLWAGEAVLGASHPSTRSYLEPRAGHPGPLGLDLCERHPGHWLGSGLAHPCPPGGKLHQGLVPLVGEVTVQVNRFKLRIIKITIQNKKKNPCLKQAHNSPPCPDHVTAYEEQGQARSHCPGHTTGTWQGLGLSWSAAVFRQDRPRRGKDVGTGMRGRGRGWAPGLVSALCSLMALARPASGFRVSARRTALALEIYCTVLEEAWG